LKKNSQRPAVNAILLSALQSCQKHFISAFVFSFFLNMLFLAPTLYMLQIYDRVVPTSGVNTLIFLTILLVSSLICLNFLDNLRMRILSKASIRLDRLLSAEILERLYTASTDRELAGKHFHALRQFDYLKSVVVGQPLLAVFDVPWMVIYLAICFLLHPYLGIICLLGGISLAIVTYLNEKFTYADATAASEKLEKAYAKQERLAGKSDVIGALGMRRSLVELQLNERRDALDSLTRVADFGGGFITVAKFIRMLIQSVAIGVGAWLAINNQISPGSIFASSLLMTRAFSPMEQIIGAWRQLSKAFGAVSSLNDLFNDIHLNSRFTTLPPPRKQLRVENLVVVNHARRSYFLNGVSFDLNAGEMIGLIGPSGAGKTTLARAIVGAQSYDSGAVRFDGAERRDWDSERLADHVGFLPQDTCLFDGSIRDNICRFKNSQSTDPEVIDLAVVAASKIAGVHDLIMHLPNGYNTILGQFGISLSAGQTQRIGLARAMFGNPFLLVLDEPNAHLDLNGELELDGALSRFRSGGGAVLIIAHRPSVLRTSSKILLLRDGRTQFYGPHEKWLEHQNQSLSVRTAASQN
jgi:ATP-binding cassette subfamily C protein